MNDLRLFPLLGMALIFSGCGGTSETPPIPALPQLDTHVVQAAADSAGRTWDGVVEAVQQADLAAQTSGRVLRVAVDVNDGVEAGDVLLQLTDVEQQSVASTARAQVRAAEAAAVEAQATYARYLELGDKQFVSRLQLDQAKAIRDSAVARRDAARAQLAQAEQQADYTVVRAPFAGIVSARQVEPGESVSPAQALLSVYVPGALRIEVQVPQSEADAIRETNRATILLGGGSMLDAASVTVFPAADPSTHSVPVRLLLPPAADGLHPGTTAKVLFPTVGERSALRIPRAAVVQRGEVSAVYVLDGQRLSLRQVRLGQVFADQVEVLAGLAPGETLAADPIAALQALTAQRRAMVAAND